MLAQKTFNRVSNLLAFKFQYNGCFQYPALAVLRWVVAAGPHNPGLNLSANVSA
jgi:hypothetical protein